MNVGLPLLLGWANGDILGMLLLAGVLRLVISHHVTFFINSLAHIWGSQPYTDDITARDNGVVALLTYGEGYHNFHHMFAHDYRNGVRWWQWDPSKWFITTMRWLGLATNLKRTPWFKIQRALLDMQFRRAERQLAIQPGCAQIEQLRRRVAHDEIVDHTQGAVHLHRLLSHKACGLTYVRLGPRYGAPAFGRVIGIGVHRRDDGHRARLLGGDEHIRHPVLQRLELADGHSELFAGLEIIQSRLVQRHDDADGLGA